MKVGFNLLLWTTAVTEAHSALGSGHVPWEATFAALVDGGYDGWLTIEAFGRALPELAAATRIWRDPDGDREAVWRDGAAFIRAGVTAAQARRAA